MHRNRQVFLGVLLPDDVLVQIFLHLSGSGQLLKASSQPAPSLAILPDDIVAQPHTFGADKDLIRALYERFGLIRRPAAEAAN
jgi:hypothetical protein